MDTSQALSLLTTESENLGANIGKETQLQSALDVAIKQLQGLLDTPSTDLANEKSTHEADNIAKDATIADLQSKLDAAVALAQAEPTPLTDSTLATP